MTLRQWLREEINKMENRKNGYARGGDFYSALQCKIRKEEVEEIFILLTQSPIMEEEI